MFLTAGGPTAPMTRWRRLAFTGSARSRRAGRAHNPGAPCHLRTAWVAPLMAATSCVRCCALARTVIICGWSTISAARRPVPPISPTLPGHRCAPGNDARGETAGTYHYVAAGEASWADLADAIFDHVAQIWGRRPVVERSPPRISDPRGGRPIRSWPATWWSVFSRHNGARGGRAWTMFCGN